MYTDKDMKSIAESIGDLHQLMAKKVLITGCTGLIGRALTDCLIYLNKKNYNISIYLAGRDIEKMKRMFRDEKITFLRYDASESIEFSNINFDYIIHAASNSSPNLYIKKPVDTVLANVNGINNICQYIVNNSGGGKPSTRLLYISSSEVYGLNNFGNLMETQYGYIDILNTRSSYAVGKRAAENLCQAFHMQYGVDYVIARPGHIYGPGFSKNDKRVSALFFEQALSNHKIVMKSDGKQLRSYCYILDCISALFTILLSGKNSNAYNISSSESVTIRDFANEIARQTESTLYFDLPSDSEVKSFNKMEYANLCDEKLRELGWNSRFTLKTGVASTLGYLRRNEFV